MTKEHRKSSDLPLPDLADLQAKKSRVLAVDPGMHKPGWALFDLQENLIKKGSLHAKGTDSAGFVDLGCKVRNLFASGGDLFNVPVGLLVLENQYTPQETDDTGQKIGRGDAVQKVAISAGVWIGACPAPHIVQPLPSVWGAQFGILQQKSSDRKKVALWAAKQRFPSFAESLTSDEADAILMGLWALGELRLRHLFKQA